MAQHNPYVGPRPFTEAEERFFFGRAAEIEILTSLVIARRASLLFAQSGAGKSSLLMAGLTPRLLRYARIVRHKEVVQPLVSGIRIARVGKGIEDQQPENIFIQSVALSLADTPAAPVTVTVPRDITLDAVLSSLMPSSTANATAADGHADANPDGDGASLPFLLVFDQFEELFTRHLALRHHRENFFTQVRNALSRRDDLRVLFSMREDYLAEMTSFAHLLPDQLRPRYRLERLKFDTAVEAVRKPAESAETPHPFAEHVAEELCRNLQSSNSDDIEPILLQVACKRLWQNFPDDRSDIRSVDLKTFGDVDSALQAYYDDAIATVVRELATAGQPISERRVRRFFSQQLLTPSRTRALVFRDDESGFTAGLPNAAIDILSRSDINILRGERRAGSHWYELSHDRLIQPVLEGNTRWEAANVTLLQKRAIEWNSRGRRDRELLTRLELRDVEEQIRKSPDDTFTPLEDDYFNRSRQALATASVRLRMNIEDLGWAVLFADDDDTRHAIRLALAPLLEHRLKQTGTRFTHFDFTVRPGETAQQFLARSGALTRGGSETEQMPYYLLIVGSPERIPFEFQYALDAHYAVGRLHFEGETREETLLMYARYARSVVEAESGNWGLPRQAVVFGTLHEHDNATQLLSAQLVSPLLEELSRPELTLTDWQVAPVVKELATYDKLLRLLGGDSRPALLFSAAHGASWTMQDERRQRANQGAIVCADWQHPRPLTPGTYVSARDVGDAANPLGMIIFLVGEYGAGTPTYTNRPSEERQQVAARPFISALCQRLLSHPNGGALAVIGHVDMSWMMTFEQFMPGKSADGEKRWKSEGNTTFLNTVSRLVRGHTVGSAMEFFNTRYMQAAADLVDALLNPSNQNQRQTDSLMLEAIDVRNYIVLGDPAVRIPVDGPVPEQRPSIHVDRSLIDEIDAQLQPKPAAVAADDVAPPPGLERMLSDAEPPPAPVAPAAAPSPASAAPPGAPAAPIDTWGPVAKGVNVQVTVGPVAVFNGIGLDGRYAYPPLSIEDFARLATKRPGESQINLDITYKSAGTSYFESASAGAEP